MGTYSAKRKIIMARRKIRRADDVLNDILLVILFLLLLFGSYSLWDSKQVYNSADKNLYEIYKPTEDSLSFEELCKINPEVLGWLTVYGTGIDYPLVQGEDNNKYLNTNAKGEYNMAGSLFLDAECARDFSDYSTLIHGHHMAASAMFGDLSKFSNQTFFNSHKYGELYVNNHKYGIVFFSFLLVDAYDSGVYQTGIKKDRQAEYLQELTEDAMYVRDAGQKDANHLVVLSTCSSAMTNGRYILAGYLTDELYENEFTEEDTSEKQTQIVPEAMKKVPLLVWLLLLLIILIIMLILVRVMLKNKQDREEEEKNDGKGGRDKHDLSK